MTLDEFAHENIFEPLNMRDTDFRRTGEKLSQSQRPARNDAADHSAHRADRDTARGWQLSGRSRRQDHGRREVVARRGA